MKQVAALLVALGMLLSMMAVAQDEPLFIVIPNNNLNLRTVPARIVERVGQVQRWHPVARLRRRCRLVSGAGDDELVWLAGTG